MLARVLVYVCGCEEALLQILRYRTLMGLFFLAAKARGVRGSAKADESRGIDNLLEAPRLGDGTLGVNVGETAAEHWSDSCRGAASDGISDNDGEHWWVQESGGAGLGRTMVPAVR